VIGVARHTRCEKGWNCSNWCGGAGERARSVLSIKKQPRFDGARGALLRMASSSAGCAQGQARLLWLCTRHAALLRFSLESSAADCGNLSGESTQGSTQKEKALKEALVLSLSRESAQGSTHNESTGVLRALANTPLVQRVCVCVLMGAVLKSDTAGDDKGSRVGIQRLGWRLG
jgi:hypothetical protein